jgi:hypothetical protein
VSAFLHDHFCHQLIPESEKVVVIDVDLPVRQAFHALHEQVGVGGSKTSILGPHQAVVCHIDVDFPSLFIQGIASTALWDGERSNFIGVISASGEWLGWLKGSKSGLNSSMKYLKGI